VGLPEPVSISTTKVAKMLMSRTQGEQKNVNKVPPTPGVSNLQSEVVAAKPLANLNERFDQSKKTLGSGMYGIVRETDTGTVVKKGDIGENEVSIQKKLSDVKGVPKVYGVEYLSGPNGKGERGGIIEMEKASGKPLIELVSKSDHNIRGAEATKVLEDYMRLRKELHTRGISHGDMHDSNVTWDGKRMGLIDFGNSKEGYKSALSEALGTLGVDHAKYIIGDLKDWGAMSPREVRFQQNLASIKERAAKPDLTEPEAKTLVEALYNGI
jgi:serine/threonine protein kinase